MQINLEELEYQKLAINSVVKLFQGQTKNTFSNSYLFDIRANLCTLSVEQINANIKTILSENELAEDSCNLSDDNDYCVEMETGTGKTLVYIRTIYELYNLYGFTKFIIFVPSIAVKEGVLSTLRNFEKQLKNIYGFTIESFEYDSKKLTRIKHFISQTLPQIMVMTVQSFISDDRIINQEARDDSINGMSYLQAIGKTQPIVIMDEPQEGMDTDNIIERIKTLNPLCKIRYSATHKVLKNLLFRLTPYDAYKQGLVKKIEVLSVVERNDEATLKIELVDVQTNSKQLPQAKFKLWKFQNNKFVWQETRYVKVDTDLSEVSKNVSYQGYVIERIYKSLKDGLFHVKFTNGIEIIEKQISGDVSGIFRQQIQWLITRHYQKKAILQEKGIKCLSLLFIDRVDNYVKEDGLIRKLFEEGYINYYKATYGQEPTKDQIISVQGSYFAKNRNDEFTDNEVSIRKNKEIYDLILRNKEKLLSLDNPVEFIFSHSALGVGWDNPNVFNIATLNQSYSDIKKRQEIGRGLRICLNQEGKRVYDNIDVEEGNEINLLTIIPNECYETFAIQYQQQIKDIYGDSKAGSQLRRNDKGVVKNKKTITRNKQIFESTEFNEFWSRLSKKTEYTVSFLEGNIVDKVVQILNDIVVPRYEAEIVLTKIKSIYEDNIESEEIGREIEKLSSSFSPIDIIQEISDGTKLSLSCTTQIITQLTNFTEILKNPLFFVKEAIPKIKNIMLDEMLRTLTYTTNGKSFDINSFKETFNTYLEVKETPNRGLYDKVICESEIEKNFVRYADIDPEVVCFVKLPTYFYKIKTPIGNYTPDWGIVIRRKSLKSGQASDFYFVIETKATNDINDKKTLTEEERYKIKCAIKHFTAIGIQTEIKYIAPVKDYQDDFKRSV